MENKIIDEIKNIKKNNEQHKIKHLTILLVGMTGIGSKLVKYIFEIDEEKNVHESQHDNFIIHYKENFPIKIIEFKGIGYDKNKTVETIAQEAFNCINEQKEENSNDYNEFIHCIWYLISGERFNKIEYDFLVRLRSVYKDLTIPIIMVYNQLSEESSQKMKMFINQNFKELNFVEVSPAENKEIRSNKIISSFGRENLIKETLSKCSQSLEGDMIVLNFIFFKIKYNIYLKLECLMTNIISNSVREKMLKINKEIDNDIIKSVENEINDFKTVLSDDELKNYVVKLFENSIYHFYKGYNNNLSNESLSLLNKSNIIQSIDKFIQYYKPEFGKIINSKLDEISKTLINEQASIEKAGENMKVDLKRNIKKFKETTKVYFKRNYYFISQRYIIK